VSERAIEERRTRFKIDVQKLPASSVVDRHIIFGDSYILHKDSYFYLKEQIADHFKIHPPQVVMVGSGKLGFSIAHPKRYRSFGETSDLDIAIVAPNLFDRVWEEVFKARGNLGYWPGETVFSSYLARGWIRPDKLPPARVFEIANDWWKFFDSLAASGSFGRYKIRGGLYRDWAFLKGYQNVAVLGCKGDLETATTESRTAADGSPPNAVQPQSVVPGAATATEEHEPVTAIPKEPEGESQNPAAAQANVEESKPEAATETDTYENNSNEPKT
jgi:hypothetical protein